LGDAELLVLVSTNDAVHQLSIVACLNIKEFLENDRKMIAKIQTYQNLDR
jgi:hypothetical protein